MLAWLLSLANLAEVDVAAAMTRYACRLPEVRGFALLVSSLEGHDGHRALIDNVTMVACPPAGGLVGVIDTRYHQCLGDHARRHG